MDEDDDDGSGALGGRANSVFCVPLRYNTATGMPQGCLLGHLIFTQTQKDKKDKCMFCFVFIFMPCDSTNEDAGS